MNLEDLNKKVGRLGKRRRRVGRGTGSGRGKTCGRGAKGAGQRSGVSQRLAFDGGSMPIWMRIAKRGFNNNQFRKNYAIINLKDLNRFDDGDTVSPDTLKSRGVIKDSGDGIKILGFGEIEKKLTVQAHKFSASAMEKIVATGGKYEVID